ncbi:hypothetical protein HPB49_014735 [Dermacentor silvarum]|uniref:Uncharacterized protein n=1 Tax=Dermacentor silvarum TaxID=543639 RepID=A0ACB8CXN5_DERSI|nr:hypothetical protein HPB49_014735 [Dermacentor silvarum]
MSTIASKWLCPDLQGCRVLLRLDEGNIEGVVADVSQKTARITLEQIIGMPEDLPKLRRPIATDFEVIDEVNDQLSEAVCMQYIVATSSKVYIFDVQSLKKTLFDHGMKDILESYDIEKVADVVIYLDKKLEAGDCHLPSYVRGIQNCLRSFLNLTYEQMKYTRSRQGSQEIDALAKDVVYLGELAHACLKRCCKNSNLGVEFFLGLDRDCNEENCDACHWYFNSRAC